MQPRILTPEEVAIITDATRPSTQLKRLQAMGITCGPSYEGRPLVHEDAVREYLGLLEGRQEEGMVLDFNE